MTAPKKKRRVVCAACHDYLHCCVEGRKTCARSERRRGFRAGLRKAISVIDEGQRAEEWAEDFDAETALRELLLATPKPPKRKSR